MSHLVLGDILGVFLTTWTADAKSPVQDCENLLLPVQMQLLEKSKAFSHLFVTFFESTSNVRHFQKEDDCHS